MEKILENLVNDKQFAEIFATNIHKYSETPEDPSSDSPKHSSPFASSTAFSQNLPLQYFSAYSICIEANCNRMARKFYMEFYGCWQNR